MTDGGLPGPAWYDDPSQPGQQRWWDGAGWTDHVQQPPAAPPQFAAPEPLFAPPEPQFVRPEPAQQFAAPVYAQQQGFPAPHAAEPYTPVSHFEGEPVIYRDIPSRWGTPSVWALALSPVIAMLAVLAALIVQGVRQNPQPHLVLAIVFLVSLLSLLFAVIDRRALLSFGYPEPAHWAWVFLSPLAYLIVRYVRTRAQAGVGGAPLWTHIALVVTLPFTVGIFSAIAIPVFLNQQGAAVDAQSRAISANTEVAIISELVATGSQFTTVTCPEDVEFTPGGTFQCTVASDSGEMSVTTVTFGETEYDITFTDPAF